jgi:hypothetical protein
MESYILRCDKILSSTEAAAWNSVNLALSLYSLDSLPSGVASNTRPIIPVHGILEGGERGEGREGREGRDGTEAQEREGGGRRAVSPNRISSDPSLSAYLFNALAVRA